MDGQKRVFFPLFIFVLELNNSLKKSIYVAIYRTSTLKAKKSRGRQSEVRKRLQTRNKLKESFV